MGEKPKTKKEEVLERQKRFQKINYAEKVHKESMKKAYVAAGGFEGVAESKVENEDWQDKVSSLRKGISRSRKRSKDMWKSR